MNPLSLKFYIGNSMVARLEGLKDHRDEPVVDATVTLTLLRGEEEVWAGPLAYVEDWEALGDPDGTYEAQADAAVVEGEWLDGTLVATAGGATFTRTLRVGVERK